MKKQKCPFCDYNSMELESMHLHLEKHHNDLIPASMSIAEFYYSYKTGKTHGKCVMCKSNTTWNENTNKFNRFCGKKSCKDKYVKEVRQRMIGKYGKVTLLNDPEQQRKMLQNRKISGQYKMSDGGIVNYTGSYELDFLRVLDLLFGYSSTDIMMPSPHTYYYNYEGRERFYIPDIFIPSLGVEIEIKDGGDNPNTHHKIQAVDKEKEILKDNVMKSQNKFHYIKIVNKNYNTWSNFLNEMKKRYINDDKSIKPIIIIDE